MPRSQPTGPGLFRIGGNTIANNHLRGEADFSFTTVDGEERIYTLKFNNQSKVAVEQQLRRTRGEILRDFAISNGEADEIRFGLFFHGTRKYHGKEIKTPNAAYAILDEFDDARAEAEDGGLALNQEFMAAVMSAYQRQSKQELLDMLRGDEDSTEENAEEEEGKASSTHLSVAGESS